MGVHFIKGCWRINLLPKLWSNIIFFLCFLNRPRTFQHLIIHMNTAFSMFIQIYIFIIDKYKWQLLININSFVLLLLILYLLIHSVYKLVLKSSWTDWEGKKHVWLFDEICAPPHTNDCGTTILELWWKAIVKN